MAKSALELIRDNIAIIRKLTFEARELLRHQTGAGFEAMEKLNRIIEIIDGNDMKEGYNHEANQA